MEAHLALLPIDLTTIASGTGGFVILGENAGDQSGFSEASAVLDFESAMAPGALFRQGFNVPM